MIRRQVSGIGPCAFYVYKRGEARVRVRTPYWEDTFYRQGDDASPIWESKDGTSQASLELSVELETLFTEASS